MDSLVLILVLILAVGALLLALFVFPEWFRNLAKRFARRGEPDGDKPRTGRSGTIEPQNGSKTTPDAIATETKHTPASPEDPEMGWTVEEEPARDGRRNVGLGTRIRYYLKGNELGFSYKELKQIMAIALRYRIYDLERLLIGKDELSYFLKQLVTRGYKEGLLNQPQSSDLIYKLFSYRLDIERNRPRYRRGIASTRTIPADQELRLIIPGFGTFSTKLIENYRPYLCVEIPVLRRSGPTPISWKGREMEVSFWRPHDGLYSFESVVMNDPARAETRAVLNLSHSDHLTRTQKRSNVRVSVLKNGYILPLNRREDADEVIPPGKGWLCKVVDISSSGAAILVRGRVKPGRLLKLTIELGGVPVVMSGEIKAVNSDPKRGVSLLHLEAIPLSKGMRARVIAYTLGLLTEVKPKELNQEKDDEASAQSDEKPVGEITPESLFGVAGGEAGDPDFDRSLGLGDTVHAERELDELFPDEESASVKKSRDDIAE